MRASRSEVDAMSICKSDWKKFKGLRALALDRFCQGVLADAKIISPMSLSGWKNDRLVNRKGTLVLWQLTQGTPRVDI